MKASGELVVLLRRIDQSIKGRWTSTPYRYGGCLVERQYGGVNRCEDSGGQERLRDRPPCLSWLSVGLRASVVIGGKIGELVSGAEDRPNVLS